MAEEQTFNVAIWTPTELAAAAWRLMYGRTGLTLYALAYLTESTPEEVLKEISRKESYVASWSFCNTVLAPVFSVAPVLDPRSLICKGFATKEETDKITKNPFDIAHIEVRHDGIISLGFVAGVEKWLAVFSTKYAYDGQNIRSIDNGIGIYDISHEEKLRNYIKNPKELAADINGKFIAQRNKIIAYCKTWGELNSHYIHGVPTPVHIVYK